MRATRVARSRRTCHYLMCPPTYFDVRYAINPWMDPSSPPDPAVAEDQWYRLYEALLDLGHRVDLVDPAPDLPDMVFAANAATVVDDRVLLAAFRHPERQGEVAAYESWFRAAGFRELRRASLVNEGEGDHLLSDGRLLAADGFRTAPDSHGETADYLRRPVLGLTLVDPRYYHLDTALAVLDDTEVMYYPPAFDPSSRARLAALYPDAVLAGDEEAAALGMNAISDGVNVLLPAGAAALAPRLRARGFEPRLVEIGELLKAGGGPKCCVLRLHHGAAGNDRAKADDRADGNDREDGATWFGKPPEGGVTDRIRGSSAARERLPRTQAAGPRERGSCDSGDAETDLAHGR